MAAEPERQRGRERERGRGKGERWRRLVSGGGSRRVVAVVTFSQRKWKHKAHSCAQSQVGRLNNRVAHWLNLITVVLDPYLLLWLVRDLCCHWCSKHTMN
ncbi:hypothetical protein Hanom_Chr14g01250371 [Helianthus anomalus]